VGRHRQIGSAVARGHDFIGVAGAELGALREIGRGRVRFGLGQLVRDQQHFEPGGSLAARDGGLEGEPEDHDRVQQTGEEHGRHEPVAHGRHALPQLECP
jgi:hypothetical protein